MVERERASVDDGAESVPVGQDAPLREQDVSAGDRLDDRVSEGEGLPGDSEDGEG